MPKVTASLDMVRASAGGLGVIGRELQLLESITLNGKTLTARIINSIAKASLSLMHRIVAKSPAIVTIAPQTNTSLEGLYQGGWGWR